MRQTIFPTLLLVLAAIGCEQPIANMPVTASEYREHRLSERTPYPRYTVVQHNLQRALDDSLTVDERTESLKLADSLGGGEPTVRDSIGELLGAADTPEPLRLAALTFLLRRNAPGLRDTLTKHWAVLDKNPRLRAAAMAYLGTKPVSGSLSQLVRSWAASVHPSGKAEMQYRQAIANKTRKNWVNALIDAVNDPQFSAKGSAVTILSQRLTLDDFRRRVAAVTARDPALYALQIFSDRFDYVPTNGKELYASVMTVRKQTQVIPDAQRLVSGWMQADRYRFNIRDFHLVSHLSRDVLRKPLSRVELTLQLRRSLMARQHVRNGQLTTTGNFTALSDRLTMADLYNIYLLDEMLARPRMQQVVKLVADSDRRDRRCQWGGLVFYETGKAEPKLSPSDTSLGDNDRDYRPTAAMVARSRNSLCRFVGHFDEIGNIAQAAPTTDELSSARADNFYGLVLTTLDETHFSAHYYNPRRIVVSLGVFPLRK